MGCFVIGWVCMGCVIGCWMGWICGVCCGVVFIFGGGVINILELVFDDELLFIDVIGVGGFDELV